MHLKKTKRGERVYLSVVQNYREGGKTKQWTYREKMAQANREAKATVVALAIVVVVWIAAGFGLSAFDVEVFGTPIWVFGGTLGTWIAAIVAAVVLGRRVFADFDLDEEERDANN